MDTYQPSLLSRSEVQSRAFIQKVYLWMSAGLAVTGLCAGYMASDPVMILNLIRNRILFFGLMAGELGLVIWLSAGLRTMEASTAKFAFLFYSALTGVTMSVIFLAYTQESIAGTFLLTAGLFGAMSAYGYLTKTDLTSMGNFAFMALLGVILSTVVNFWLQSPAISWVTTYLSVLIFTGLTAYDTQKIKALNVSGGMDGEADSKLAISGALALYLDFINLFLSLLRLTGRRRD